MRKCFWLQRKSMWRSRTDSLAMKGLTKRRGIKRLRKGGVNSGSLQTWKVPDQYNLIVALNPLMSWQDVASLSVKQSFALCYALHPLCRQAAAWSWRRSEVALLDLNNCITDVNRSVRIRCRVCGCERARSSAINISTSRTPGKELEDPSPPRF